MKLTFFVSQYNSQDDVDNDDDSVAILLASEEDRMPKGGKVNEEVGRKCLKIVSPGSSALYSTRHFVKEQTTQAGARRQRHHT